MKEVKEDWSSIYRREKINIKKEIEEINFFGGNINKVLLECFKPGDIILEAGCGTGKFCFWLEEKGVHAIGIDIVPGIIKVAANYARDAGFQSSFIVGDVSKLPFRDNSFDGYISLGVIEHFRSITDVIETLNEAKRVIKQGGKIVIVVPNIFVPLRNKILLYVSRGRYGLFHEFYTIDGMSKLGQRMSSNFKITVFDIWLPIYNIIDGILKRVSFTEESLSRIKLAFIKLPSCPLLKYFLGYICLIAEKS